MAYWLDLFTPYTWTRFREHGADVTGFRPRQRTAAFERVKRGDQLLCYLVKLSRWCGILEVVSDAFEDGTPIFADSNDPFPIRFRVEASVALGFEHAIPIVEPGVWNQLSLTKDIAVGARSWAQHARLRQSLVPIPQEDGDFLSAMLRAQSSALESYPLDASDRRNIDNRTIVRTQQGEVEVEVPDREDVEAAQIAGALPDDARESIRVQARVARLGIALGFSIWLPASDRTKVSQLLSKAE